MRMSWFYFFTVFWSGAAVLVVEISAIRLLSIQFGSSLTVLSGVLAVILFALSCGYFLGGKLADYRPSRRLLYTLITAAGITLLALSSLALTVTHPAHSIGTTSSPLTLAFFFFFLPAFILGIDSPFVTKLLTLTTPEREGALVGLVFFWSTLGSIVGSLSTGFVLLPQLGVEATFFWTSCSLVVLGVLGLGVDALLRREPPQESLVIGLLVGVALAGALTLGSRDLSAQFASERQVLHRSDGFYSHLMIFDSEREGRPARFLKRETNLSSGIFVGSEDILFEYTKFMPYQIDAVETPESLLVIGGGAYTIPKAILERYPSIRIDVAELEPSLLELAQTYFELPASEQLTNHVADGRQFLKTTSAQYDVIYLDAFNSGHYVPPHLVTKEYFSLVRSRLTPDGVLIINFIGTVDERGGASLTGSFTKTVAAVFPNLVVYQTDVPGSTRKQNLLYQAAAAATDRYTLPATTTFSTVRGERTFGSIMLEPAALIHADDEIFTDDRSKAELLTAQERW